MLYITKLFICFIYFSEFYLVSCKTIFMDLIWPTSEELSFMKRYGYLPSEQSEDLDFAYTPQSISDAVRRLQNFAGIQETGILDAATKKLFSLRRCGLKDIEDSPYRRKRYVIHQGWNKKRITYRVLNGTSTLSKERVEELMEKALSWWAPHGGLTFIKQDVGQVDIDVSFTSGDHGDGVAFDGQGQVVAHAFPPPHGDIHFDNDEIWGENPYDEEEDVTDFFAAAVHEIGHSLGLSHSSVTDSVMYPYYQVPVDSLQADDILGMQEMYLKNALPENESPESTAATETSAPPAHSSLMPRFTMVASSEQDLDEEIPDLCWTNYDTIQVIQGKIHVFEEEWMWIFSNKKIIEADYPKRFHEVFIGLPENISAIKTIYENRKGNIVIFHGKKYWEFNNSYHLIATGNITQYGIPGYVPELTTVFLSNYNNKTYLIEEERFWRYDESRSRLDSGYPKAMFAWRHLPYPIDAALIWEGDTYFFRGPRFWRFDNTLVMAHEYYPLPTAQIWFNCSVTSEMYRYTSNE